MQRILSVCLWVSALSVSAFAAQPTVELAPMTTQCDVTGYWSNCGPLYLLRITLDPTDTSTVAVVYTVSGSSGTIVRGILEPVAPSGKGRRVEARSASVIVNLGDQPLTGYNYTLTLLVPFGVPLGESITQ